jgi:hypothetical protein
MNSRPVCDHSLRDAVSPHWHEQQQQQHSQMTNTLCYTSNGITGLNDNTLVSAMLWADLYWTTLTIFAYFKYHNFQTWIFG